MAPLTRGLEVVGEDVVNLLPHADDAVGHTLDLSLPLRVEGLVAEDGAGNASAMGRRVGVHRADDNLELRVDAGLLLGIGGGQRKGTRSLAIETHVLRERLSKSDLMTLSNKVAKRESITGDVSRSEALVGHIEEGEELLLLDDVGDGGPLLGGGVDTGRVVSACVEQDDRAFRGSLQKHVSGRNQGTTVFATDQEIGLQAFEVESNVLLVEVTVMTDFEARVAEQRDVVPPGRSGDVDSLGMRVMASNEFTADSEGTSSGDALSDRNL